MVNVTYIILAMIGTVAGAKKEGPAAKNASCIIIYSTPSWQIIDSNLEQR